MSAFDDMPDDIEDDGDDENSVGEDRALPRLRLLRKDGKPTIPAGTDIARQVDQAIDALRSDVEMFVRGGALTRIIASDGTDLGPIQREPGSPVMRRHDVTSVRERLSKAAVFTKWTTKGRGEKKRSVEVEIFAPAWIAAHVIGRGTWPSYRRLEGVVTSPTIRRDGSVLQTPGYDTQSGLVYIPTGKYRPVPHEPKMADAIAARDRLLDVIVDFPLVDLGRAGWLSLLFTLCARDLVEGCVPMFAIDAHTAASGKGLLFRSAHVLAYGVDVPHMSMPPNDEEFRKQITTTLLAGDRALLLDNVSVPIGGDSLETLVTAPLWKARLLGKSEDSGELVPKLVIGVTGNGIALVGDMGRRTLRIRLDTPHENPEQRTDFTHPERASEDLLLRWLRAHRTDLVIDALTCLRAWHVHGRGGESKSWGSFNGWVATIGRCVQWLGLPDPTDARATADSRLDIGRKALAIIYDAIDRLTRKRSLFDPSGIPGVTAGDVVRTAFPSEHEAASGEDDLAEAIETLTPNSRDNKARARVLGRKLKVGQTIQGRRLIADDAGDRVIRYRVEGRAE